MSRAASGARVVTEPRRGFGAACFTGLLAARSRAGLLHGRRRLARPARAPAGQRTGRTRRAGPLPRSPAGRARRVAAARPRRQPADRRASCAAAPGLRSPTSVRCGARRARSCSRSVCRTGRSAGRLRWSWTAACGRLDDRRDAESPTGAGLADARRSPARLRGTWRAVRDMSRLLSDCSWPRPADPARPTSVVVRGSRRRVRRARTGSRSAAASAPGTRARRCRWRCAPGARPNPSTVGNTTTSTSALVRAGTRT